MAGAPRGAHTGNCSTLPMKENSMFTILILAAACALWPAAKLIREVLAMVPRSNDDLIFF